MVVNGQIKMHFPSVFARAWDRHKYCCYFYSGFLATLKCWDFVCVCVGVAFLFFFFNCFSPVLLFFQFDRPQYKCFYLLMIIV